MILYGLFLRILVCTYEYARCKADDEVHTYIYVYASTFFPRQASFPILCCVLPIAPLVPMPQ